MGLIKIDDYGYSERQHEQNWAAEYARRLVTNEVKARIEAVDAEAAARAAADAAERTAREQADSSLHAAITSEELVRKAAIEAEAKARDAAISAESKIRQAAEAELSKRIDQEAIDRDMRVSNAVWELEQRIAKVQNNLLEHKATETTERTEGDRALSARIDELSLACGNSYSETAQKIGTWIDGTPVWRAVMKGILTPSDISWDLKIIAPRPGVINLQDVRPICGSLWVSPENNLTSAIKCVHKSGLVWHMPDETPDSNWEYWGYIDFVTEESNIKEV